ncbi:MAG TPA: hypothetical protein VJT54_12870 [Verrucomicrobiae bacterium]|nr:hypothetical protein [Verrucomicrobiae bacterium]
MAWSMREDFFVKTNLWMFMMPVKIQCGCGQRYAFDIEPFCGRMPFPVACPVCGADGTGAANEVIAFTLATELSAHNGGRDRMMLLAIFGCLMAGIVGVIKASTMASGLDVLLCLWGSVLAFSVAIGVYIWKQAHHLPELRKKRASAPARHAQVNRRFRVAI